MEKQEIIDYIAEITSDGNFVDLKKYTIRIPSYSAKLFALASQYESELGKAKRDLAKVWKARWEYYTHKASPEAYRKEPFSVKISHPKDVEIYMNADRYVSHMKSVVEDHSSTLVLIENGIKEVTRLNWAIKNIIELEKLEAGIL